MMRLVNDDHVRHLLHAGHALRKISGPRQIRVVENHQGGEIAPDIRQVFAERPLPNGFAGSLWHKHHDPLTRVHYKQLDEHHTDESVAHARPGPNNATTAY